MFGDDAPIDGAERKDTEPTDAERNGAEHRDADRKGAEYVGARPGSAQRETFNENVGDRSENSVSPQLPRAFRIEIGAKRVQRDVDEEVEFHLAMRARKLERIGLSPGQAREQALLQFGDVRNVRDECVTIDREHHRTMNRVNRLHDLRQDVAYGMRSLRHNMSFAFITILILAIGIGANTAIFSLVDVLILRPLPVPHAEQLVTIGDPTRTGSFSDGSPRTNLFSYPLYADIRDGTRALTAVYATGRTGRLDVLLPSADRTRAQGTPQALHPSGRMVTGNYFSVLQVGAFLGRTFATNEGKTPGDANVVVVGYEFWQRQMAGDPGAVGRVLSVNGSPFTIIGVAAKGFTGDMVDRVIDVWLPVTMQPSIVKNADWLMGRGTSWLQVMGRRAPGVSVQQVKSEITGLVTRSMTEHASASQIESIKNNLVEEPVRVENGAQGFSFYRSQYTKSLVTLMGAVALVLLVVCANVANLLLARATARAREMSLRMALGANRLRLVQQLFTESLIIAVAGGVAGIFVATWASQALLRLANGGRSGLVLDTHPDARILAFGAFVSLATAVLFGLVPALRATRVDLATALRASGRNVSSGNGRFSAGRILVVAQVAMSVLLLVGTGMLVRSLQRLESKDIGAERDHLLVASIDVGRAGYSPARMATLMRDLTARIALVPGVMSASASENGIFSGTESAASFQLEGFTARQDADTNSAYDDVGAGYFRTVGARLLQGRDIQDSDNETGTRVAVVNKTFAAFYFPNGNVIGHHLTMDSLSREIVGVVADVNGHGLRDEPTRRFYIPMAQYGVPSSFYMQVQTSRAPSTMIGAVRSALLATDPQLLVRSVDPLDDLIRDSIRQDRLVAQVVTLFGVLVLLLSAMGLYGVMAYATVRRTSEFGLRLALGAKPASIVFMVLRDALAMTVIGLVVGLPVAFGVTRLLREQLFGIPTVDVPSIGVAIAVLVASATLAAYLPAMRAARVAPLDALRAD